MTNAGRLLKIIGDKNKKALLIISSAASVLAAGSGPANATVVVFDFPALGGREITSTNGHFTLSVTNPCTSCENQDIGQWTKLGDPGYDASTSKYTAGFLNYGQSVGTLSEGGKVFTLSQFGAATVFNDKSGGSYTLKFNAANGNSTTIIENLQDKTQLQIAKLPAIPSTSVDFYANSSMEYSTLQFGGIATTPEPAAWALMVAGVAAVGGALRRRRAALSL